MSLFPTDDKARKAIPLFRYFTRYFPKAHREVAKVCVVNNVRYNPDRDPFDIYWARGKSPDQLGSGLRHMMEREVDGKVFDEVSKEVAAATGIDRVYVLAQAMWRIGAALELDIEQQEQLNQSPPHILPLLGPRCPIYCIKRRCVLIKGHTVPHLFEVNPMEARDA